MNEFSTSKLIIKTLRAIKLMTGLWKQPPSIHIHKYATTNRPKKNQQKHINTAQCVHTHKCKSWAGLWAFNDQSRNYCTFPLLANFQKEKDKVCVPRRLVTTRQENSVLESVSVWSEYWGGTVRGHL